FRYLIPALDAVPGPVGAALRLLAVAYRLTRELPVAAAVEQILEMTGLLAWAATGEGADTLAGNLHRAVDRLRLCAQDGGTLADSVERLAADLDSGNLEALGLEPGRRDVVRLMNLHKAKGLEAPVVFLADPCIGSPERVDIRITRGADGPQGYLSIEKPVGDFGHRIVIARPTDWEQHAGEELQYVKAEESRLRYVAATRARDLLVIGRYHGKSRAKNPTPWMPFDEFLQTAPELDIPSLAPPAAPALPDLSPAARAAAEEGRTSKYSRAASPSFVVRAVTELSDRAGASDTRSASEELSGLTREPAGEAGPGGTAWGTLIHSMLEAAMRAQREMTDDELSGLATFLTIDALSLRSYLAEAVLAVRSIMASDVWQRARSSPECHTEVPFAVEVPTQGLPGQPPDSPPRTLLQGVIDLVYRIEGGWEIVDYKTDLFDGDMPSLVSRYSPQLKLYSRYWSDIANEPVVRAGLLLVRSGETVYLYPEPRSESD
ncbi:MAG: PD-(D/E)XK nuclease family protein, partial [candidate division NC10 bacterium]|nr:PD-(D/E)XK nuclease family protein [candidate division NC10 bacterium]